MAWTVLVRKVWYFMAYFRAPSKIWESPTVARIYLRHPVMYSQDQVCDSNHAECVLFSQSLVTRHNTKAYFLQHNAGCSQFCNNPRFPVRRQSMGVKIMRIDLVAHRLVRELIADCLGPTFKTHVRSFMNKGHVVKNASKLLGLSFYPKKLLDSLNGCRLWGSSPFGGIARSHARAASKRRRKCKGRGKRGEIFFLAQCRSFQFLLAPCF